MTTKIARVSVTIPNDLYSKAKEISDNFSSLVTEALKEYFRKANVQRARESFGAWKGREEDSVGIANKMRKEERGYASRSH